MKLSPLQLEYYFVADSHVTANKAFSQEEPLGVSAEDIIAEPDIKAQNDQGQWEVVLRVQYNPGPGTNTPYSFSVELVAFFRMDPNYMLSDPERRERLVRTNGPTILFGIARGIVRDLTGRGPYSPMILPTASFVVERKPAQVEPVEESEPASPSVSEPIESPAPPSSD